jgi:GH24 family phage-related lysozyme (muramidase)
MAYDNPFGLNLLKRFEGYTAKPKWDHKQYSVGYSTRWTPGTPIGTREDHENALREEAGKVDSYIGQNVKVPLDENKRAALVSFGFNLGPGAIGRLLPDINAGNWDRVGQRMLSFSRAGDNPTALSDRRRQEVEMLRGGGDLNNKAAAGADSMPANYMTQALNAAATIPTAQPVAGTTGTMGKLPDFGPIPSERRRAMAEALYGQSFRTANSATNPLGALAAIVQAGVGSHLSGKYDDEKASRTRRMAEALAGATDNDSLFRTMLASGDDDLIKAAVSGRIAAAKPKDPIEINGRLVQQQPGGGYKEVYAAPPKPQGPIEVKGRIVQQQPDGTFKEVYAAPPNADPEEFGTSPQYYKDPQTGELRLGQLSKRGGMKSVDVPGEIMPSIHYGDTGTAITGLNTRTGQVVSQTPKDIVGKEAAEERGKLAGQAQAALPAAKTTVENAFQTFEKLRKHPGLDRATGISNWADPRNWAPGTTGADFFAANQQAMGQSFMAARDALKGAGQVTDFEGAKGEQAIANITAAQSTEQYLAALDNLERMMRSSYEDMQRKAGMASGAPALQPLKGGTLDEARKAIERGAPKDAVVQRLRERGFDPSGL